MVSKILVRFRVNLKFRNEVVRHCCLNQIANIWVSKNPKPGQMLLLCSDGVWEFITPMEVATSWRTTNPTRFSWDGDAWLGRNLLWESGWIWGIAEAAVFFHLLIWTHLSLKTSQPSTRWPPIMLHLQAVKLCKAYRPEKVGIGRASTTRSRRSSW